MNNFKAGELAIIVRDSNDYNLMKEVQLIEFVQHGQAYMTPDKEGYGIVNMSGKGVWVVLGDVVNEAGSIGFCQKAAENLMPLKGDFAPVKEKEEELV